MITVDKINDMIDKLEEEIENDGDFRYLTARIDALQEVISIIEDE